jgi:molybdate transport system substrate-binding protein
MDEVVSKHHADGTPAVFVTNKLVVIAPRSNPARIHSVADLATNGVKVVLAAAGVPAGDYARQMFEGLGIGKDVAHNVVSNEIDDKSVVAKVLLGDADAGVVYVTDLTPDVQSKVTAIQIPAHDNVIASYPIAPVTGGDNLADGRLFVRFVLSAEGRRVLDAAGFGSP